MKGNVMKLSTTILSVAALGLLASAADAHALLKAAGPAPGSVVTAAPKAIRIQFSEGVELAFSGIELKNQAGQAQTLGAATLNPKDKAQLIVPVNGDLAPGKYTVSWHAVGGDTHRTEGSFNFELKP
jgi:copper resistance protein C